MALYGGESLRPDRPPGPAACCRVHPSASRAVAVVAAAGAAGFGAGFGWSTEELLGHGGIACVQDTTCARFASVLVVVHLNPIRIDLWSDYWDIVRAWRRWPAFESYVLVHDDLLVNWWELTDPARYPLSRVWRQEPEDRGAYELNDPVLLRDVPGEPRGSALGRWKQVRRALGRVTAAPNGRTRELATRWTVFACQQCAAPP
eukprot:gene46977-59189_t